MKISKIITILIIVFCTFIFLTNNNISQHNNEALLLYEDLEYKNYLGSNFECKIIDSIMFEKDNFDGQIYKGKSTHIQYIVAIAIKSTFVKRIDSVMIEFDNELMNLNYSLNNPQNLGNLKIWSHLTSDLKYDIVKYGNDFAFLFMEGINSYPEDYLSLKSYTINDFLNAASSIEIVINYNYFFQERIKVNDILFTKYDNKDFVHKTVLDENLNKIWGINLFTDLGNKDFKKYITDFNK